MSQNKRYFVTGIDTDAGKTLASAILTQQLKADYWKPIQAGEPTDSDQIRQLIDSSLVVHPEGVMLQHPMSPHAAARRENVQITADQFTLPETSNTLIIEGAGGLMVPFNAQGLVIDLAKQFEAEVILVSRNYLGSINHTLLSVAYLQTHNYPIKGIIFNGDPNEDTESFILQYTGLKCLGRIPMMDTITADTVNKQKITNL
ncbi:dethiobiotin synthetase [Reichenbachiella agariperforans]|uniref:ATP-dependent dethiobiotin synthetase BioD n=1 Tax=Reichenbachiella agariperforans TaxID=156994 RepID=A0A1M6T4J3_REIAG|nr:dethiobiotin synthase [Reichenbachiella agariperforans]SHK51819.1 dethiobiotin synthetase [Reichenbachiella agariperforans]